VRPAADCHLSVSWLPKLEEYLEAKTGTGEHPDYRLWLTSSPTAAFPVAVLQNGVKLTMEPPRGIKAQLRQTFLDLSAKEWDGSTKPGDFKQLLFACAFYHSVALERRKFGPLGWNTKYAFDESDLETSIAVLRRFLVDQETLPWDALNYVTGQINYGGRVTDDWDRRCLMSMLSIYMVPEILTDGYTFSASGKYYSPPEGSMSDALAYFDSLPTTDDPEVFGMHTNANVTFNTNESLLLMATLLSLQPRASGGGTGKTSDDVVVESQAQMVERYRAEL
jgi:dynein heavy chain